jgi:hypothetical protein
MASLKSKLNVYYQGTSSIAAGVLTEVMLKDLAMLPMHNVCAESTTYGDC